MGENGLARRNVVIVLGTVCIVLAVGLVGTLAFYTSIISEENNKISALNSQISQLEFNVTHLQDQLNGLLNVTVIPIGIITSDLSIWVNRTVIVEGNLSRLFFPVVKYSPWSYLLSSGGQTVGVSLSANVNTSASFWSQVHNASASVRIYGVVEKGEIMYTHGILPSEVTYYIEAEIVEPL